jgi:hypothetical protein
MVQGVALLALLVGTAVLLSATVSAYDCPPGQWGSGAKGTDPCTICGASTPYSKLAAKKSSECASCSPLSSCDETYGRATCGTLAGNTWTVWVDTAGVEGQSSCLQKVTTTMTWTAANTNCINTYAGQLLTSKQVGRWAKCDGFFCGFNHVAHSLCLPVPSSEPPSPRFWVWMQLCVPFIVPLGASRVGIGFGGSGLGRGGGGCEWRAVNGTRHMLPETSRRVASRSPLHPRTSGFRGKVCSKYLCCTAWCMREMRRESGAG